MKRNDFLIFLLLIAVSLVSSCSSDDESDNLTDGASSSVAPLQVTIVFEPGQLGDKGTNDLLQREFFNFADAHKDSAATTFVSLPTYKATIQAVRDWAAGTYEVNGQWSMPNGQKAAHRHRLLVLTSPALGQVLTGLTLRETDRVLMLSTPLAEAKKIGPAGRTHVMNISLAAGVNRFLDRVYRYFGQFYDMVDAAKIHDGPFRIYHLDDVLYADSISEAIHKRFPSLPDNEDGILATSIVKPDDAEKDEQQDIAYMLAALLHSADGDTEGLTADDLWQSAAVVSLGIANQSYDYYFFTHRTNVNSLLVGERTNVDSRCDYVSPRFPLQAWLTAWAADPENRPEEEWHGDWDGCAVFTPGD